ncbi:hypothetical protein [Corynebacterium qintianiae]|uniref:hypothetical protein n=1 Tax=Corynebacterium qintianiae TaxID=2709392 RepID=UPI0013ED2F44|nr:hypothetical protein [Corynebacterium qintianiae]
MSNPTFKHGPIGFDIAEDLDKFRLVRQTVDGKIEYADATGAVFGAVTEAGRLAPEAAGHYNIAVHYGTAAVKLETTDTIQAGAGVFAAADGKVSATGTVQVGVAVRATEGGKTLTILNNLPYAAGA